MLARINGGNSGIREYLESGFKQGREYGREDLDNRVILDGNIDHLEKTINSIENKGQDRYLHITLSFAENDVEKEILKAVTEDYKSLLMNAYHQDEFCFYAEAHLPKIKKLFDKKTREMVARKPHIHIIIPRKNLVTLKSLNPVGDLTNSNSIKLIDSIQEHVNIKYNLVSPKDSIRVSDNNHANVLSRYKGDFFMGKEVAIKKEIFNDFEKKSIQTQEEFFKNLSRFGEVKIYNKGKENQYYAVKLPDNNKFTRLKSPLFSENYITKRELLHIKPTIKEIEKNLTQWKEKTSHEIKHIYPSSHKNRETYKALSDEKKTMTLKIVREKYNDRYHLTDDRNQERDRALSARRLIERGFKVSGKRSYARLTSERLPSLQERYMVHELQGYRGQQTRQSDTLLSASKSRYMAETQQKRQYNRFSVRRTQDNTRGINSNLKEEEKAITHKPDNNDLQVMKEIRSKIDPDRFLSFCADKYKIDPKNYTVTFSKDGSPRFNEGKRNLNASDFLTQYLKIDWKEAKVNLIEVYNGQLNNTKFNVNISHEKMDERSITRKNYLIRKAYYQELKKINKEYQHDLFKLTKIKDNHKREVERGFALFNYLKAAEKLNTITATKKMVANEIRSTNPKEDRNMAEIYSADKEISFSKSMEKKKTFQQYQYDIDKGIKLTDLICGKKDKEITYIDKNTRKEVFSDKGNFLHIPDTQSKEKIALALEYAEKKFGGKLQLSGSEEFKMNAAMTAAEKGMNIILTPEKYHQMMLDHVEKIKQSVQQEHAFISKDKTQEQQEHAAILKGKIPEQKKHAEQNEKYTVDGKMFNKLIVVPVKKDDGYEKSVSFNVAFKKDDKIVSELKNIKEYDLQRMGIDAKEVYERSVQPVNIQTNSLKSPMIETPLKYAERRLNEFKTTIKNKEFSPDEFKSMKEERTKLENNVAHAKQNIDTEKNKQIDRKEQEKILNI